MKSVIYARVSSVSERQNTDRQVADLSKYAEKEGLEIVKIFSEKISGAKKNFERKALLECLDFAKENEIDIILVSELSRFGRAVWEVLETVKKCVDENINVFFQKENFALFSGCTATANPVTAIYISCLAMCAEIERENIQYRLNSGLHAAIEKRGEIRGRKKGQIKSKKAKLEQYKIPISLLKKDLSISEIYAICKGKNIKISESTLKRLKKEFI